MHLPKGNQPKHPSRCSDAGDGAHIWAAVGARGGGSCGLARLSSPGHLFNCSSEAFQKGGRKGAKRVMIVITDGESHDSPDLEKVIEDSEKDNVTRYAVAVSDSKSHIELSDAPCTPRQWGWQCSPSPPLPAPQQWSLLLVLLLVGCLALDLASGAGAMARDRQDPPLYQAPKLNEMCSSWAAWMDYSSSSDCSHNEGSDAKAVRFIPRGHPSGALGWLYPSRKHP